MKGNIYILIRKVLLILIFLCSMICNANKINEFDTGVSRFVKWYSHSCDIRDSFVKDSNLFYKLSRKKVYYGPLYIQYRVCLIHLLTSDSGDYWISYYIPVQQYYRKKDYIYFNIGGHEVDVNELHKMLKLIKNKSISSKGLGCKSKFYNRRKILIESIMKHSESTLYILD